MELSDIFWPIVGLVAYAFFAWRKPAPPAEYDEHTDL